jgi:hypothetical protein
MGIRFNVADLQLQFREIEMLAREFLARGSEAKLLLAADALEWIAQRKHETRDWQLDSENPLCTVLSKGECETDGKGKDLVGCLSFVWTLRGDGKKQVELVDKASTILSIHAVDGDDADFPTNHEDRCVQKWSMDVVTSADAPGPAFHVQVKSRTKNQEQVEREGELPVPRLLSLLISPADCLDFLLGELFQVRWRQHQSRHARIHSFSKSQQGRFRALLKQNLVWIEDTGHCSAWTSLKDQRPDDRLFLPQ